MDENLDSLVSLPQNLINFLTANEPFVEPVRNEVNEKSKRKISSDSDDDDETKETKRIKLRKNEQRYRKNLHELFSELGKLTNSESKSRKLILSEAIKQLSNSKVRSVSKFVNENGLDYRNLFLSDSTPTALFSLDGEYIDINIAYEAMFERSRETFLKNTIYQKISCKQLLPFYFAIFESLKIRSKENAINEESYPLPCPVSQKKFLGNGFQLNMCFSVIFESDQPKCTKMTIRIARISNSSN